MKTYVNMRYSVYFVFLLTIKISELNEPIVLNLLPPDTDAATGSHYMSSEFRMAVEERRLYLKVFGVSLPSAGAVQLLE